MSTDSVEITATFGDEEQKTITLTSNFAQRNIGSGLTANPISGQEISVQVKGVASVIEKIDAEGYSTQTMVIIANSGDMKGIDMKENEELHSGDEVMKITVR